MANPLLEELDKVPEDKKIDDFDRYIVQNIFDVPALDKRRTAYLSRLGFEVNPKDRNEIKPKGSSGGYHPIDPGLGYVRNAFSEGRFADVGKEMWRDVTDLTGVVAESIGQAILGAPAAAKAAAGAAAVSGPAAAITAPGAGLAAFMLSGTVSERFSQEFKETVSDFLVDPKIPVDQRQQIIDSVVVGLAGGVMSKVGMSIPAISKHLGDMKILRKLRGTKQIVEKVGVLDNKMVENIVKNPDEFSPAAVDGALKKFSADYKEFFGVGSDEVLTQKAISQAARKGKDSFVSKAIRPLEEARQQAVEELGKNPSANIKVLTNDPNNPGLLDYYLRGLQDLSGRMKSETRGETKQAMEFLSRKSIELLQDLKASGVNISEKEILDPALAVKKLQGVELNFAQTRKILSAIQDDLYGQKAVPGADEVKYLFGASEEAFEEGLRQRLDRVATQAGSALPEINKQMSDVLKQAEIAAKTLNKNNVLTAFKNDPGSISRQDIILSLENLQNSVQKSQQLVGQVMPGKEKAIEDVVSKFDKRAAQVSLDQLFKQGGPRGSQNVISLGFEGAVKGGVQGGGKALPFALPLSAVSPQLGGALQIGATAYGAVQGAVEGVQAGTPRIAAKKLGELSKQLSEANPEQFAKFLKDPEVAGFIKESVLERLGAIGRGATETVTPRNVKEAAGQVAGFAAGREAALSNPQEQPAAASPTGNPLLEGL